MSSISRRVKRSGQKKQHSDLKKAWRVAKRVQKREEFQASNALPVGDSEFKPTVEKKKIGRRPTFKEFVDMKAQALKDAISKEMQNQATGNESSQDDVNLEWED